MNISVDTPWGSVCLDDEVLAPYRAAFPEGEAPAPARLCYAAAHIMLLPGYAQCGYSLDHDPAHDTARHLARDSAEKGQPVEIAPYIDWPATMAFRKHLDGLGFGIAEAMDTAQRFDIGWLNASELIRRTGALGLAHGFVAGAGVDHLDAIQGEQDLVEGVVWQARFIQEQGGIPILLPLPWLSQNQASEESYVSVYSAIIDALEGPLFVHWLGAMFLASLEGYFPGRSFARIMAHDPGKVRGAKLSLLDQDLELTLRRQLLAQDQILLTGDDFHFADLIQGESDAANTSSSIATQGRARRMTQIGNLQVPLGDFSHALLGILDAIAEPASLALRFLALGDEVRYRALMQPCETLSRHLFCAPTQHYKAGLAFLAFLNGHQSNPMLVHHEERARSPEHYLQAARLASSAGIIDDATLASQGLSNWLQNTKPHPKM